MTAMPRAKASRSAETAFWSSPIVNWMIGILETRSHGLLRNSQSRRARGRSSPASQPRRPTVRLTSIYDRLMSHGRDHRIVTNINMKETRLTATAIPGEESLL
jgi:hypothetical protein